MTKLKKAIFLDRDGVLNKLIPDVYVISLEQFEWIPAAREGLERLYTETTYEFFVVSNQGGIGAGYAPRTAIDEIFSHMLLTFPIPLTNYLFCPHTKDAGCCCRKPKPGMIFKLATQYEIDLSQSWMIGDMSSDLQAGYNAGIPENHLLWIRSEASDILKNFKPAVSLVCNDLLQAAQVIISEEEPLEIKRTFTTIELTEKGLETALC